jgi:tetratricopeptide (TPR) repeat protein
VAIAKVYAQQGEFFAAALNAQKAIEIDPTNADLYGQLGDVYYRGRNFEGSIVAFKCAVRGCTPEESCQARNGCPLGDPGVQVQPLPLSASSATYYLEYGNVLANFGPLYREYCVEAMDVLTLLIDFAGEDDLVQSNTREALAICEWVLAEATPTATPTLPITPTPYP